VLVLDLSSVNDLDSSADRALQEIAGDYGRRGVELYVANAKGRVRDVMRRSGLHDLLGPERFFLDTDEAVRYAERVVKPEPEASEASDVRDVSHGSDVQVDLTREIPVADKRAGV
jgi:SulP family sulfate permease